MLLLTGARVALRKGAVYRARAKAPFFVTRSQIRAGVEDDGFTAVEVWSDVADLPVDWPQEQRIDVFGFPSDTVFVEATWGKADEAHPMHEAIAAAWLHKSPPGEANPRPSSGQEGTHVWAREILRVAWAAVLKEKANEPTLQAVQAIALHESGYGFALKNPEGGASHNWGSVQCGAGWHAVDCLTPQTCPEGCFPHKDTDAKGVCYIGCYKQYSEPFLGARDFVQTLAGYPKRARVRQALAYGNATVIAREMRASGYFEAPVSTYAVAIGRRAREIAGALREPVMVEPTNVGAGLVGLGLVAGLGVLWYRKDRGQWTYR